MIGPRLATIQKQIKSDKNGRTFHRPTPGRSIYVQISPATLRYRKLLALAERMNISYHRLALDILDWYLQSNDLRDI